MAEQRPRTRDGLFKRGSSPYWQCWIRGQRRSTKSRDREAARIVKAKLERAAADPSYLAAHQATLGGAVMDFLEHYKTRDRSEHTAQMYRVKCGHLVRVMGENLKLAELGARTVDDFIKTRLEAEGAARMTVGKELTALRQVLKVAKRHGAFPFDLGTVMPLSFTVDYKPKTRALTWDELGRLVPEVARFAPEHAAMVIFFVAAAARKSEAERAHGEDIDWASWTVKVRGTKTDLSADEVPIAEPFRPLFEALVPKTTGPLWGVWTNMTRDLAAACKRAGMPRVTANDLRRSNATLLRLGGASVDIVARMLRHADSRMVERVYGRLKATDAGRLLAAQLGAHAAPAPAPSPPADHCQEQHNVGGPTVSFSCFPVGLSSVQGLNRTGDTRIFKPLSVGENSAAERGFLLDPSPDSSPGTAEGPALPAANSTRSSLAEWGYGPVIANRRDWLFGDAEAEAKAASR